MEPVTKSAVDQSIQLTHPSPLLISAKGGANMKGITMEGYSLQLPSKTILLVLGKFTYNYLCKESLIDLNALISTLKIQKIYLSHHPFPFPLKDFFILQLFSSKAAHNDLS